MVTFTFFSLIHLFPELNKIKFVNSQKNKNKKKNYLKIPKIKVEVINKKKLLQKIKIFCNTEYESFTFLVITPSFRFFNFISWFEVYLVFWFFFIPNDA